MTTVGSIVQLSDKPTPTWVLPRIGAEGESCVNCNLRPATARWIGEGGAMAFVHGDYHWWCER